MKIALFTDTYLPQINGVSIYISDAIRVLSKEHDVVLFAPGEGRLRMEQVSPRFRIWWIPSSPFPFYEGYRIASMNYKRVSDLLRKEKPDVVHAHAPINLGLQGIVAAKRKRIPTVATYHTHYPDYVPHLLSGKLPGVLRQATQFTAKKFVKHTFGMADVVTAPTHELVAELRSYGMDNVVHLPDGIDLAKLKCTKKEVMAFRKTHRITAGKKVVLYLGRISFEKRLDVLLEAFRSIERRDRLLVVAGGGPYLKGFRNIAGGLGIKNIIFTGYVKDKDLGAAYCCADVFASASDSETFGLTFVEAMYAGVPVIGVGRLGPKDIIKDGRNGILVKPGDTDCLARAMAKLLTHSALRERMGKEARKTALGYSIEKSAKRTLDIYRLLGAGR
ncbi:MAG: glycosyltransferase [Candidatus ainarchaeum sp.]|nr:glycosyltransferase [Candidatus ainarchaeum sp.]